MLKLKHPLQLFQVHSHFDLYHEWLVKNKYQPLEFCLNYVNKNININKIVINISHNMESTNTNNMYYDKSCNYGILKSAPITPDIDKKVTELLNQYELNKQKTNSQHNKNNSYDR